jgi:hypothetical protein
MRRGPGLVRTVARTAVVAGTATVVAKGVSGAMTGHAQAQQQAQAADDAAFQTQAEVGQLQEQMATMQAQQAQQAMQAQAAPAAPPAEPASPDLLAQLQQLAQLKDSGVLTDDEFAAAKAKLLGS